MKKHVMTKHYGKKFPCSSCDKRFIDQSQFKRHIEAVHEGVKYACDQCKYETNLNVNLKKTY